MPPPPAALRNVALEVARSGDLDGALPLLARAAAAFARDPVAPRAPAAFVSALSRSSLDDAERARVLVALVEAVWPQGPRPASPVPPPAPPAPDAPLAAWLDAVRQLGTHFEAESQPPNDDVDLLDIVELDAATHADPFEELAEAEPDSDEIIEIDVVQGLGFKIRDLGLSGVDGPIGDAFDDAPEERERGITIDLDAVEFETATGGSLPSEEAGPMEEASPPEPAEADRAEEAAPPQPESPPPASPRYADLSLYHADGKPVPEAHRLVHNREYELEVAIRERPSGLPVLRGERPAIREPGQAKPVTLHVALTPQDPDAVKVTTPLATITLPPTGDSPAARFPFTPLETSPTPDQPLGIEVRVYFEGHLLERVVMYAEVAPAWDDPPLPAGRDRPAAFLRHALERPYADFTSLTARAAHIDVTRRHGEVAITLAVHFEEGHEVVLPATTQLSLRDLTSLIRRARRLLFRLATKAPYYGDLDGKTYEFRTRMWDLAMLGRDLHTFLFRGPRAQGTELLGEWLQKHPLPDDACLQITTDAEAADVLFPWALVYDRPLPERRGELPDPMGFWGLRYVIEHLPSVATRLLDSAQQTPAGITLDFLLNDSFTNYAEHVDAIRALAAASDGRLSWSDPPFTQKPLSLKRLAETSAHVLYFYTHGSTPTSQASTVPTVGSDAVENDDPRIVLRDGELTLSDLLRGLRRFSERPFVFLNMCESAQVSPASARTFVDVFLNRGAGAVLGTECTMTTTFAHPFGRHVLERVLQGRSVGEAVLDARRHFVTAHLNPLGLAYAHYGAATLRFAPPVLAAPSADA